VLDKLIADTDTKVTYPVVSVMSDLSRGTFDYIDRPLAADTFLFLICDHFALGHQPSVCSACKNVLNAAGGDGEWESCIAQASADKKPTPKTTGEEEMIHHEGGVFGIRRPFLFFLLLTGWTAFVANWRWRPQTTFHTPIPVNEPQCDGNGDGDSDGGGIALT